MELPESCVYQSPLKQRAQGKPDARRTRSLVCEIRNAKAHEQYRYAETFRPSLRNGCAAYGGLSPVCGLLATVVERNTCFAQLDPSIAGSGPHAFAVRRPHPSSDDAVCVHRIPPDVRDDAYAPPIEAGWTETITFF